MTGRTRPPARHSRGAIRTLGALFQTDPRGDPYALYPELHALGRSFRAPLGTWYVVGLEACHQALRQPELLVEDLPLRRRVRAGGGMDLPVSPFYESILFLNGDAHRRVRSVAQSLFAPRALTRLESGLRDRAREILADLGKMTAFDVYEDYAWPLQLGTLAALLGVPRQRVTFVRDLMPDLVILGTPQMWSSAVAARRARAASDRLVTFLTALVHEAGTERGDGLVDYLVRAERAGDLCHRDLLATLAAVVVAGVETTVGLLANSTVEILRQPGATDFVAAGALDDTAIAELVRTGTPIHVVDRWVRGGATVDGTDLADRTHVVLLLGAANRDPAVFPDPDTLDLRRSSGSALGFGGGFHYCLGAALARLHLKVAVPELFSAFPRIALAGEPVLGPYLNPHAYWQVPVRV